MIITFIISSIIGVPEDKKKAQNDLRITSYYRSESSPKLNLKVISQWHLLIRLSSRTMLPHLLWTHCALQHAEFMVPSIVPHASVTGILSVKDQRTVRRSIVRKV